MENGQKNLGSLSLDLNSIDWLIDNLQFYVLFDSIAVVLGRREGDNIGIKHGFTCINVCQVLRELLKTEAEGRGFQQLPRNLTNVYALENYVWSLLLHKSNHNAEKMTKTAGHYFQPHRNYLADSYTHYPFLKKSLFQAMVVYRHFFSTVSSISQV